MTWKIRCKIPREDDTIFVNAKSADEAYTIFTQEIGNMPRFLLDIRRHEGSVPDGEKTIPFSAS